MLSLFPRPNRHTLDTRASHLDARNRELCLPLLSGQATSSKSLSDISLLPNADLKLQEGDEKILSADIKGLVDGVRNRSWTSTKILSAFIRSARRAQLACNPITVPNFSAAMERARQLDDHFQSTGELVGPLHGVPFSFKEQFKIKGLTTTVGYTAWVEDGKSIEDAALAQMVQHLGGIVIAKTNIPQTMLSFECNNPLYGRTTNPYSKDHTCGGSSGGEAALLASDGSAAGMGSDIGGSLRIPSAYCGIYALKPTKGRFPSNGTRVARLGFEAIPAVVAPMCRSAADLEYLTRALLPLVHPSEPAIEAAEVQKRFGSEPLRCSPLRPHWFEPLKAAKERKRPIRIGYYACDGFIKTSPACIRAMEESVSALKSKYPDSDLRLVEIDPAALQAQKAFHIFTSAVTADSMDGLLAPLRQGKFQEPMDQALFVTVFVARASFWMRKLVYWIVWYFIKDHTLGHIMTAGGSKSAGQHFATVAQRNEYEEEFEERVWKHYELDGILCPVQASPAVPHGACTKLSTLAVATTIYNVMDNAAAVCPVTRVDAQKDANPSKDGRSPLSSAKDDVERFRKWNETPGSDTCSTMVTSALYSDGIYDSKAMHGLPVGVQLVTRKYEEEKAIGLMRLLDDALAEQKGGQSQSFRPGAWTLLNKTS